MTSSLAVALGIVVSSFFGSWHCAGMCGPIASLMAQKKGLFSYHIGRLFSYSLLGALAGYLGQFFLNSEFISIRWFSSTLLAIILIFSGASLVWPQLKLRIKLNSPFFKLFNYFQTFHLSHSSFFVGILTSLLPCGWLYTYVIAAIATKSPLSGALTLFLFWLGGLPALSAVSLMVKKTVSAAGLRQQKIAGLILVLAGLYSVASFMFLHD